jgi:hypothetical protein
MPALLLCRKKNKHVAEYALRGMDQSIAVAAWETQFTESLPEELRGSLPTIEEIEVELARDLRPGSPLQTSPHNSSQPTRFTSSSAPTLENS